MRAVNLLFAFIIAPFIGLWLALSGIGNCAENLVIPVENMNASVSTFEASFAVMQTQISGITTQADEQKTQYEEQEKVLGSLAELTSEQKKRSDQIYEERILTMLGPPVKVHSSKRVEIKVFKLEELGYRGYIAKIKLYDPKAFKVVLAKDKLGEKETTLAAVKRTGAVLGINAGGFYSEMREGKAYAQHIGNIVINGKLIGSFNAYPGTLSFAGINRSGKLIGGIMLKEEQLMSLQPWQGVTFIPTLIKNGKIQPIPEEWAKTKQPRTILGEYANGDLIMIVVDGRQADWSSGVTLERLIEKLVELGVKEGYNLDGGGSSAFVYKGAVLNKPSDGKLRPVVTNIVIIP